MLQTKENYSLGKGEGMFNRLLSSVYQGDMPLGNIPELSMSIDIETLEHFSSMSGLKKKDKEIVLSVAPKLAFVVDNIIPETFGLNVMGAAADTVQTAGVDDTFTFTSNKFRFFDTGYRGISDVAIPTYTENTDFIVYGTLGYIFIPADSTIPADTEVTATFDSAAVTYSSVNIFTQTSVEGKFTFLGSNPEGQLPLWKIPRIALRPAGDIAFISDDFLALSFEATILDDTANNPTAPYGTIEFHNAI